MPYVIWITGLPGSGKSTIASALKDQIPHAVILRMDDVRRIVTPEPIYSEAEREHLYRSLVYMAKTLYELGHTVIIDATGNRKSWRDLARDLVPDFFEIYLKCPLQVCMVRESSRADTHGAPKDIYKKGKAGAPVPGMQVPYEETERPELVIDTEKESVADGVGRIMKTVASSK